MLVDKDLQKIVPKLEQESPVQLQVEGIDVLVRAFDGASKVSLNTSVYLGGNFIPQSVRRCLNEKAIFANDHIKTYFSIDEEHFTIYLNYLGTLQSLKSTQLKVLLEDFAFLADNWRLRLDEHDKQDLVHVRVK